MENQILVPVKTTFMELADSLGEADNGGLMLKRDQGFQFLNQAEKAFLLCHLYDEKRNKARAFAKSIYGMDVESMDKHEVQLLTVKANAMWKRIENKMGGVRNIISLMGIDVTMIVNQAKRLLHVKKMVVDKDCIEHTSDDGSTQMKALEFLAKLSGNYSEELEGTTKTSININFGTTKPADPRDIESDNMEVVQGKVSVEAVEDA